MKNNDTNEPLPEDERAYFERFYRADSSRTRDSSA